MFTFRNKYAQKIYRYIYLHDGETLLIKDIAAELQLAKGTIYKYLKYLSRREVIRRDGKKFFIQNPNS